MGGVGARICPGEENVARRGDEVEGVVLDRAVDHFEQRPISRRRIKDLRRRDQSHRTERFLLCSTIGVIYAKLVGVRPGAASLPTRHVQYSTIGEGSEGRVPARVVGIRKRVLCRPVPVVGLAVILEEQGVGLAHVVLNMPAINKERSIRAPPARRRRC